MRFLGYLKHWLVPHRQNDHRPHLIRARGLVAVVVAIFALHAIAYVVRPAGATQALSGNVLAYAINITPVDLFNLTNQERVAAGLPALKLDARLNQSAALKAQNMFEENYWAHVSPSGIQPWHWFTVAGYSYQYAGENLAKDFDTSAGVMDGWMNSPGHKANILNQHYTDVGFAVVNGTLVGGETTLVVAHYGSPVATPAPAPIATPRPATPRPVVTTPVSTPVATATPELTPSPTPTPAPSPSATPRPTASPSPAVVAEVTQATPPPKSYSLLAPLQLTRTLAWPTLGTLLLLLVVWVVYLITHLTVWRRRLRRWQNPSYRGVAAAQLGGVAILILYLATAGLGHVG